MGTSAQVDDEIVQEFNRMKLEKTYRFLIMVNDISSLKWVIRLDSQSSRNYIIPHFIVTEANIPPVDISLLSKMGSLVALPLDAFNHVISFLGIQGLCNFSRVSKACNTFTSYEVVWQRLFMSACHLHTNTDEQAEKVPTWKQACKRFLFHLNNKNSGKKQYPWGYEKKWNDLYSYLPKNTPRYIAYLFPLRQKDSDEVTDVPIFIYWCPDTSKVKERMIYGSCKETVKRKLMGIRCEIGATDESELDFDYVVETLYRK